MIILVVQYINIVQASRSRVLILLKVKFIEKKLNIGNIFAKAKATDL